MGFHQRRESGPTFRWELDLGSTIAMKLQTDKPVETRRRLFAAMLLGLWVVCGLFCVDHALGCGSSAAPPSDASRACCEHHGTTGNLPDENGQTPEASGTACCDSVTKPTVEVLQPFEATASFPGLEPSDVTAAIVSINPTSRALLSALPDDRAFRTPPIQLLGVAHLPHGPPAHA